MLYLRENHQTAIYVACGDLTDIFFEGEKLVVLVEDQTMQELLGEGRREIERALSWQGLDYGVEIRQKIIPPNKKEEDIKVLKQLLGDKLKIKGD